MRRVWSLVVGVVACGGGGGGNPDAAPGPPDAAIADAMPDAGAQVTFVDPGVLHDIAITIAPADLPLFDEDQTVRVHCDVTIDGTLLADSGCRKKGGVGSIDPVIGKPAFSIQLDEYVPGQKYLGLDRYVLDNAIQDPSLLREHIAYEVFRRAGVPAHRTAFAQASLNGEAKGIYVVVEPVDKEFLRERYGSANDQGNLYESSTVDFVLDPDGMELKDPVGRTRDDLNAAATAIDVTPDDQFALVVGGLVDLAEFAAFFAVEIVLDAEDGLVFGRNNHFMYHRPDTDRFVFFPHGQDVYMVNPAFDATSPPAPRFPARVHAIPALRAMVDDALAMAIAPGGAGDPDAIAARITEAVAIVSSTTLTDDFTVGDVTTMTRDAAGFAAQFVYRKDYITGTAAFPTCGDGVIYGFEQCDDGNLINADGCDDQCYPECTATFTAAGESWRLCPAARDWATQVATCQGFGGTLAVPADAADAATITSIIRRRLGSADVWLGLTDELADDTWLTATGAPAPYLDFAPNEPNGGSSENCLVSDVGRHRDRSCDQGFAALCRL